MSGEPRTDVIGLTAKIVSAHITNNATATEELPLLIKSVYRALETAGEVEAKPDVQAHAVAVKRSVFPEFIICLEDGKKMKTMKRHLMVYYNMTPDEYRTKWGLPPEYPMVARAYATHRSTLAKKAGLGRRPGNEPVVEKLPARRAKGSKG